MRFSRHLRPDIVFAFLFAAILSDHGPILACEVHEIELRAGFEPPQVTVAPGDIVRWLWNDGFHTVTSGSAKDCEYDGVHFHEPLWEQNPVVEFRIPLDMEGEIRYFCLPHCLIDEAAIIFIEPDPCPADLDDDGMVGFSDLLSLLDAWGLCDCCREDLDGNGIVNFNDLLILLAAWGPCE